MTMTINAATAIDRTPLRHRSWFGKRKLVHKNLQEAEFGNYEVDPDVRFEGEKKRGMHTYEYECNLVTSKLPNGKHAVLLDLDYDAMLVQSRTAGHHHLYLDTQKQVTWKQYKRLLKVLAECRLIEKGYYRASRKQGWTAVRKPQGYVVGHAAETKSDWEVPF